MLVFPFRALNYDPREKPLKLREWAKTVEKTYKKEVVHISTEGNLDSDLPWHTSFPRRKKNEKKHFCGDSHLYISSLFRA